MAEPSEAHWPGPSIERGMMVMGVLSAIRLLPSLETGISKNLREIANRALFFRTSRRVSIPRRAKPAQIIGDGRPLAINRPSQRGAAVDRVLHIQVSAALNEQPHDLQM